MFEINANWMIVAFFFASAAQLFVKFTPLQINNKKDDGCTMLHVAAYYDNLYFIKVLADSVSCIYNCTDMHYM